MREHTRPSDSASIRATTQELAANDVGAIWRERYRKAKRTGFSDADARLHADQEVTYRTLNRGGSDMRRTLVLLAALLILAGCTMPTEPQMDDQTTQMES